MDVKIISTAINTVNRRRMAVVVFIVAVIINTNRVECPLEVRYQSDATVVSAEIFGGTESFTAEKSKCQFLVIFGSFLGHFWVNFKVKSTYPRVIWSIKTWSFLLVVR